MSDAQEAPQEPQDTPEGEQRELTREEMAAAEMLRRLMTTPVQDVVMQTMATFTDMAAIRMGLGPRAEEDFDLPQAGLAIESLRALLAVTNAVMGPEAAKPFAEPLSQLQMAFSELVEVTKAAREGDGGEGGEGAPPRPATPGAADAADALWTPGAPEAGGGGGLWTPGS
jgi:hypothetical protein